MGERVAYYNEIDPFAAATLRELIADGEIAPGVVDERDIRDISPIELAGYRQCHFFAGAGVWSYALRRAGWPDDRPIWTGSCPCQPFSTAGKGLGFDDERHLWPAWDWLIDQCRPVVILGEQVADKGADAWIDLVQADVEGMGYAFGCVPLASAGFGAPNPRHRSFWVANAARCGCTGFGGRGQAGTAEHCHAHGLGNAVRDGARSVGGNGDSTQAAPDRDDRYIPGAGAAAGYAGAVVRLADAGCCSDERRSGRGEALRAARSDEGEAQQRQRSRLDAGDCGSAIGLADAMRTRRPEWRPQSGNGSTSGGCGASVGDPGPVNGFWRDADWLYCRDPRGPRWRPVNRGTFPLAPGAPGRVGALRISGNAINAEVATAFIEAVMETLDAERIAA